MEQATTIFLVGILGVFAGMALIFLAIKITARVADYFQPEKESS